MRYSSNLKSQELVEKSMFTFESLRGTEEILNSSSLPVRAGAVGARPYVAGSQGNVEVQT